MNLKGTGDEYMECIHPTENSVRQWTRAITRDRIFGVHKTGELLGQLSEYHFLLRGILLHAVRQTSTEH